MPRDIPSFARKTSVDGPSTFDAVLDQLLEREPPPAAAAFRAHSGAAFDPTYAAAPASPGSAGDAASTLYEDADLAGVGAEVAEPPRSIEDAVARELRLSNDLEPAELERIRRRFAYRNHPDRVAPGFKGQALERMTIANVLIDQALKAARARAR
ncbi:MAG: hypothetical protein AB7O44_11495 [Hyphomicrobiaceae bacterium]